MKILITGGDGFIARNLREQFSGEYDMASLNSRELDLLDPVNVYEQIAGGHYDAVIHAATYDAAPKHSVKDPSKVLENNLKMFFNLARCRDHFGKMIYFGSGAEFGREYWAPKMKEDYFDRHVPADQYGFSKYIMAKYAQSGGNIYNLRLFGVFGKYDDWRTRFIPNACCHAVSGLPVRIEQNKYCDFIYIDDLARIVKWFMDNQPGRNAYNACSGKAVDFKTIAEMIVKISGKKLGIEVKTPGFGREYTGDNSLLLNEIKGLNFSPLEDSLRALYGWYDSNKDLINKEYL